MNNLRKLKQYCHIHVYSLIKKLSRTTNRTITPMAAHNLSTPIR